MLNKKPHMDELFGTDTIPAKTAITPEVLFDKTSEQVEVET